MLRWFDAHLDLAYLAECGRDMLAPLDRAAAPHPPASVTLDSLRAGGVGACLGTIFTEPDGNDAVAYPAGDAAAAAKAGLKQLERYEKWARDGHIHLSSRHPLRSEAIEGVEAGGTPAPLDRVGVLKQCPSLGILVEGADPILSPDHLHEWVARGVVTIGLTWARASRYAGGNSTDLGLTDLGRAMIGEMDRLGIVHDASHLSDRAMDELFTLATGPIMASHSNCRAIVATDNQRHLRDPSIREIASRGGVIGLNLFSPFLVPGGGRERRATIVEAIAHVERICDLAGHRGAVGLGSDMDGGFSAAMMPDGIDTPSDLVKLAEALSARNWSDGEIRGFAHANWERFFETRAKSPGRGLSGPARADQ